MYYFLKKSDFNLERYNFNTKLNPKLTKKEYKVLKILIDNYKADSLYSELKKEKWNISEEKMPKVVNSLMKKSFKCEFYDENKEVSKFFFNIFNIVAFEDDKLIYTFSESILKSLKKHNLFNRIGIFWHLNFMHLSTKIIYNLILKENKHKGSMELSLEELKALLGMNSDKYPRFYDFETKVLAPIAKDMEISEIFIWFEKIKKSNSKSSKIIGVKIHFNNLYHVKIHKETNNFLREYSDYIQDFTASYKLIYQYINRFGLEKTILYLKENYNTVFNVD